MEKEKKLTLSLKQGLEVVYKKSLPWKQYERRNLRDSVEAVTFIHDVDRNEVNKQKCFVVYKELLAKLQGMPKTLEECERMIQPFVQAPAGESKERVNWKAIASGDRKRKLKQLEAKLKIAYKLFGAAEKLQQEGEGELQGNEREEEGEDQWDLAMAQAGGGEPEVAVRGEGEREEGEHQEGEEVADREQGEQRAIGGRRDDEREEQRRVREQRAVEPSANMMKLCSARLKTCKRSKRALKERVKLKGWSLR